MVLVADGVDAAVEGFDLGFVFFHYHFAFYFGGRGQFAAFDGPFVWQELEFFDGFPVAEALVLFVDL